MVPGSEGTCFTSIYLFIHLLMHLFSTISERLINLSSGDKLSPLELVVREADTEHRINTKHGGCTQRLWVQSPVDSFKDSRTAAERCQGALGTACPAPSARSPSLQLSGPSLGSLWRLRLERAVPYCAMVRRG